MPRKTKQAAEAVKAALPSIPKELIGHVVPKRAMRMGFGSGVVWVGRAE